MSLSSRYFSCLTVLCTIVLALATGFTNSPDDPDPEIAFSQFRKNFSHPAKEYGSAPLWVWNTKVTKPIIDSMMLDFKAKAFGGVMVHPRPGLITEYLSQEWYELFQYTVKRGKELGLNVWIYDENSYPSGFAGGLVPAQMPESYNRGQLLQLSKRNILPTNTDSIFVCLKESGGNITDITSTISQYKGISGNYYLFAKLNYSKQTAMVGPADWPYVDLMVKGVTEKFIDVTMKGYEKVAGNEFGKTVPGIFSDEPNIMVRGANMARWTPDLFSTFKQRWGYDLQPNLASLFEDVGDWKKVRHNYVETLSQLFIDRWSKPMFDYTNKHNLNWTGHYWEHGWPSPDDVPDNMAMYAFHQYPGIDMLFNNFREDDVNAQFGNIRSVKELRSVANQLNKKRTLSETYGGGGWDLTFKDMKRLGDWEFVLGVNLLNQHLSWMTVTGARKYDYPQSFSYHNPWFEHYKPLNEYFQRLSYALSQGEQKNEILIIEPTTSAWMYYVYGRKGGRLKDIGNKFQVFVTTLEKAQVEYDLGSENIIKDHGRIENGKFVVGQARYSTVVIPPGMENIDSPTFKLLKDFADKGGKVLGFERLQMLDGSSNTELQRFNNPGKNIHQFAALNPTVIKEHFSSKDFTISPLANDTLGGNLYHHRRRMKDGQLVFLSNASMNSAAKGVFKATGADALLMDLPSGEILDYPESKEPAGLSVRFDIPVAGSILFFIADKKQEGLSKYKVPANVSIVKTAPAKVLRPRENTLMIDFCDVSFGEKHLEDQHVGAAALQVFNFHGLNRDPWDHQVQYKNEYVDRDTFKVGTGFTAIYHFNIADKVDFSKFRAVVEQGSLWSKIMVNGNVLRPIKDQWWLDRDFGVLDIGKYLKAGQNTLSLAMNPMSIYAEIEPVYILGDFNLASATKGFQIIEPQPLKLGSWAAQGLPLYGQSVKYVKEVNLPKSGKEYQVQLGKWEGTVAAVKVNGQEAGIISSEPNTLNISEYLKPGKNRVEVEVVGSLKNLLGPHHNSPKPGVASPGQWKNIKSYPSGDKYQVLDYGLTEDFKIIEFIAQPLKP
ncbi:MAG: hypothetical protein K0S09_2269 [Sphingobacteriaceae bacterium]|jgi:hypothetical protein|nr:hypothetical protein [Sphingobacteriaceae bacterium]